MELNIKKPHEKLKFSEENKEQMKETKEETTKSGDKSSLISKECISYLNYRIKQEELSSRLYLSMSMYLNNIGYIGAAKALKKDADDEMTHADWAREYLLSLGIQPQTPALEAPKQSFGGLPDIIRQSHEHEIVVTNQINDLGKDAMAKQDFLLLQLVVKYQQEQIEEMDKVTTRLDRLELFGEAKDVLMILDQELGEGKI